MTYDVLSINIGITPQLGSAAWSRNEGATTASDIAKVTPVKPIDRFARRWDEIIARVRLTAQMVSSPVRPFQVVMVGAGAGGVELCLAMYARLQKEAKMIGADPSYLCFTILNRGPHIMANHNKYDLLYFSKAIV